MLTYNRGQWTNDERLPDEWEITVNTSGSELTYTGYEKTSTFELGLPGFIELEVFYAKDDDCTYMAFATMTIIHACQGMLVADYPSLLMLIKELEPIIRLGMDFSLYDMTSEEHTWKAGKKTAQRTTTAIYHKDP